MKKILNNMAAALVLMAGVAFCTVSCQEDPITGPAEFSIVDAEVSVPAEGGVFSATYTLDNPVLGEEVKITCDADWISDINTLRAYEISFDTDINLGDESREATVNVEYNGGSYSFIVAQSAFAAQVEAVGFNEAAYYGAIEEGSEVANYFIVFTDNLETGMTDALYYAFDLYGELWTEDVNAIGIPEGTYTLDSENAHTSGTFSSEYSYYFGYDENGALIGTQYFTKGTLKVVRDGEDYNFEIIVYFEDGTSHRVTYSGPVSLRTVDL